jgi:hypothetical protein
LPGKGGDPSKKVASMPYRPSNHFRAQLRQFSRRTLFFGAACLVAFVVASFIDIDALLEYFHVLKGATTSTLEDAAAISIACAVPFLATGMSISADSYEARRQDSSERRR